MRCESKTKKTEKSEKWQKTSARLLQKALKIIENWHFPKKKKSWNFQQIKYAQTDLQASQSYK